jgi:chemotaxis protein MotB
LKKEKAMAMARRLTMGACGLVGLLILAGCQNPDRIQIQAQADEIARLQQENADLRSKLAQAISERDAARNRLAQLEQENANLRGQLAAKPVQEAPGGWKHAGPFAWVELSTDFLFDSGKATLRPAARAKLQEVVGEIKSRYPDMDVLVLGHTDTDPILKTKNLWTDNLDLSINRGATVFRELQKMGMSPQIMMAAGQGEYNPVASNSNRAGKQQNRRVEIIVLPHRGAPELPGAGSPEVPETTAPK